MTTIRLATVDDSPDLARLQVDSYRSAYASLLPPAYLAGFSYHEQEQDWRDWLPSHPTDLLLVAEVDSSELVAYALARRGRSKIPPYDAELVALHVRQAHQRQGIGRLLMAEVATHLRKAGCGSLMLWVMDGNPACGFYERLGGKRIGEQTVNLGEGLSILELAYGWREIGSLCETPPG